MTARITKSRDPILASLTTEYMAALDAVRFIFSEEQLDRIDNARTAMNARAAMFRPKRVRKAERKAAPTFLKRLCAGPLSRVPKYMQCHGQELGLAKGYIAALMHGEVAPEYVEEFKPEARNGIYWAKETRIVAGQAGRRLP